MGIYLHRRCSAKSVLLTIPFLFALQGGQRQGRLACSGCLFYERAAEGPSAGAACPELPAELLAGGDASPPFRLSRQALAAASTAAASSGSVPVGAGAASSAGYGAGSAAGCGAGLPAGSPDQTVAAAARTPPAVRPGATRHGAAGRPGLHSHVATARRHAWTKFFHRAFGGPSVAPSRD